MKNLVIVESPTKAKTISKFLGPDYKVESSFGHIRDLPAKEMGVDIENNFKPKYVVPTKASKQVKKLKELASKAETIWFASDEDREGEAIAWHLKEILKPKDSKRITFHEITKKAIEASLKNPREIDMDLVDAQQARRILDRLVGYELSPFLWKKITKGLSAGRVQSVAVRLVVEKEREIEKFKAEEYWTIEAIFNKENNTSETIEAKLYAQNDKSYKKFDINTKEKADEILEKIKDQKFIIADIKTKEVIKKPPVPFKTSTLQQDANNKLGFSAKQTMMLAQQLYEGIELPNNNGRVGLITYMRTDSLNLSEEFLQNAQNYIKTTFGDNYAKKEFIKYATKSKNAQEAHEAIRPTHVEYSPEELKTSLDEKQYKLYKLVWSRSLASQMQEAIFDSTSIDINTADNQYTFRANGQIVKFDGFMKVYQTDSKENILPKVEVNENVDLNQIEPKQHFTQPPARYTEASLVKILEEYGIGRPSTYAPTLSTIQDRNYVEKIEKRFKPTDIGIVVNDLLVEHFPQIVDYQFTAKLEDDLDEIADNKKEWQPVIKEFYEPFHKNLEKKYEELTKTNLKIEEKTDEICDKCQSPMVIKLGRFGKFMACSNYPECKNTKQINANGEEEKPEILEEKCPDCGKPLTVKHGRFGKFIGCTGYPDCKFIKSFSQNSGVKCPSCENGEIVSRKGPRGIFFGCSNYPKCKFTLQGKPTGETCPKCKSLMIHGPNDTIVCSNKQCTENKK